jgi:flagellar biosynthesis chaperone FliJ
MWSADAFVSYTGTEMCWQCHDVLTADELHGMSCQITMLEQALKDMVSHTCECPNPALERAQELLSGMKEDRKLTQRLREEAQAAQALKDSGPRSRYLDV